MYTLRLLGPSTLEGPDGPLSGRVTQERKLALLAVLALAEGRTVSRDSLAAMFWPESDVGRARHNVADSLWVIRSALGGEAVHTRGHLVSLDPAVVATDVEAFQDALRDADHARAVDLYTGRFMEGFHISGAPEFEHWLDAERARLEAAHRETLEALIHEALRGGRGREAPRWARRLAAADPLNTRRALLCMDALAHAGDPAGAVLHGEGHLEVLESELGIPPPAEVVERIEALRTGSFAPSPAAVGATGGGKSPQPAPGPPRSARTAGPQATPFRPVTRAGALVFGLALTGIILASLAPWPMSGDPPELVPNRIVVVGFENRTGDDELDLLARLAADVLLRGLTQTRVGDVVLPTEMAATENGVGEQRRGPLHAGALAVELRAGITVSGTLDPQAGGPVLVTTVTSEPGSQVVAVLDPEPVDPAHPGPALERLSSRVVGTVAAHLGEELPEHPFVVRNPSYESYRAADRATRLFLEQRFDSAGTLFRRAWELDPSAVGYLLWEGISYQNLRDSDRVRSILDELRPRRDELTPFDAAQFDWLEARARRDLVGSLRAARTAHALHPHSGLGGFQLGLELLRSGRFQEAREVYRSLDPDRGWLAGFRYYWYDLAIAYHMLGRHEEELTVAEEGYRRHPDALLLTSRLRALAALGRGEELQRALGLSTDLPDHALIASRVLHRHGWDALAVEVAETGLRALAAAPLPDGTTAEELRTRSGLEARLLIAAGRLQEAHPLLLELLSADADPYVLGWAGVVEARLGLVADARARIDALAHVDSERFTAKPRSVVRATIHAELGDDPALVRRLLEEGHREGWPLYAAHFIPLLDPVRDHPDVRGFFEERG